MEAAVNKLEAMFQKAESDLDYIEHKLEFEIVKNLPQSTPTQENPVKLLEQLRVIKSHYHELSVEADQIASEQKEAVDFIRSHLATTLRLVQKLREQSDLKEPCAKPPVPQQAEAEFEPITEKMFMSVPKSVRLTVKLADLNAFYQQLFDHFIRNKNRTGLLAFEGSDLRLGCGVAEIKVLAPCENRAIKLTLKDVDMPAMMAPWKMPEGVSTSQGLSPSPNNTLEHKQSTIEDPSQRSPILSSSVETRTSVGPRSRAASVTICSALSVIQMNKLNMKATESKLKTLKALEILQLDKKGRVRLFMQCPKC
ncbi:spindle and kinetochore-associated protein 2 isoform X2 [Carcharodon carcharias]|uniref:spindle and kinetochore-associated protein 2 isoform X2 n=1 Tax=Carcharodon carcharias TaxID=13397 RepID=UPI001B7F47A9|nr:spindle and kinetochore-associated protein 2 isoform X2 [Carcharodon carcharias]